MIRNVFILCLLLCSGCFNGNNKNNEPEELHDFCGTRGSESSMMKGPDVFRARCSVCHRFNKDMTGPKLEGILDRVPSEEWLRNYITNEDSLIKVNDEYALKIARWSPVRGNHNNPDLSTQDLDTLINFITQ